MPEKEGNMKKIILLLSAAFMFISVICEAAGTDRAKGTPLVKPEKAVNVDSCFDGCHETVNMLYTRGAHKNVNCGSCHTVDAAHLTSPDKSNRPAVSMGYRSCGQCHKNEASSMVSEEYHDQWALSNPWIQNYMYKNSETGTTNTMQAIAPRTHAVALSDLIITSTRGRYQFKDGRAGLAALSGNMWDLLYDAYPEDGDNPIADHGLEGTSFRPHAGIYLLGQSSCFTCKTSEMILEWPYGGDPAEGAKYSLQTKPVEIMKGLNVSLTCNTCHDPHSAEPRIVRDTIIKALTDPLYKDNVYQSNPERTKIEVVEMGERGYMRKIAILEKYDSAIMCGQCHSFSNRGGIRMADNKGMNPLLAENQFPILMHPYEAINFFKEQGMYSGVEPLTGARIWGGAAHVQWEAHAGSIHAKAGVGCADCHYAEKFDKKKKYTSHQNALPMFKTKETCLKSGCHGEDSKYNWDEAKAQYSIKIVQQMQRKRLADLETSVNKLMLAIVEARKSDSVDKSTLDKALDTFSDVNFVATFWLKEYSGGFHNPDLSEQTLVRAYRDSNTAIAELTNAMKKNNAKK